MIEGMDRVNDFIQKLRSEIASEELALKRKLDHIKSLGLAPESEERCITEAQQEYYLRAEPILQTYWNIIGRLAVIEAMKPPKPLFIPVRQKTANLL